MERISAYERRADFLSSIMQHVDGFSLETYRNLITFKHHRIEGYYRGEDSGARYPEYSAAIDDATFWLDDVLDQVYYDETIVDLLKRLRNDRAEWIPIYRHKKLVSFLIERTSLPRDLTDSFSHSINRINAYYDLDFVTNSWDRSLCVVRDDKVLARYNVKDVYYDLPRSRDAWGSRYTCYCNLHLMYYLYTHPELIIEADDFDNFGT